MTRVLVFCEKWESGGVEAFVTTLLECMDRTGLEVTLAACKVVPGPYDARLAAMGIAPVTLGEGIRDVRANLRAFGELLARGSFDAVHLNVYEGLALVFARAARRAGVGTVIVHGHNTDLRPSATRWAKLALHRACVRALGGCADERWAPSAAAGRFMFGGRPFTLVRNGIVPGRFAFSEAARADVRARLGLGADELALGCVGRLCQQKNQLFLLQVLARLPQARLLLVGEDDVADGSHEALVRARARELGVQGRVTLCGRTDDPAPLYQAMDILCLPSAFEALGIVAVEAQAAGLPVVASPAVPPEADAGGRVRRVPLDADAWAAAVREAAAQPADRSLGCAAVARAGYDMRVVAAKVRRGYGAGDAPAGDAGADGPGHAPEDELVSVIVPVYNVAPYVGECLASICAQTHANLEVVVVDDGSTDGSGQVCDDVASRDARVRVIHQANAGLSAARNAGLSAARGEWVSFVDGDDALAPSFLETLLAPGADIAQCAFATTPDGLTPLAPGARPAFREMDGRAASRALQLDATGAATVVWNKLYCASLLAGVRFPMGRQHEDEFVTYRLLWGARSVAVTDASLYYYRQRPGSIMDAGVTLRSLDALDALDARSAFYRAAGDEELASLSDAVLCNRIGSVLAGLARADAAAARTWGARRDALLRNLLRAPAVSAKKKAALLLQRACPGLYQRMRGR